jgi:RNA polymerase sigma-32 factor
MRSSSLGFNTTPEDNLSRYLQEIKHFPLLEYQEELSLSRKWRDSSCRNASHRLVTSHLRLVVKIATSYRGYGLPFGELISEGNVGMMQAVNRFDPEKGFRLSTYAMWWIRAAIQEYVLHSWSLVKMGTTAAQKKLFFNLRKLKSQIQAMEDGDMTPEHTTEIADRLNVSENEVVNMNRRMAGADHSLNAPLSIDGEGEWLDWLQDDNDSQENIYAENEVLGLRQALLSNALESLSSRESHILEQRRLKDSPMTLENLSRQYGISRERVRQIEVRAFEKVQKSIKNAVINESYRC